MSSNNKSKLAARPYQVTASKICIEKNTIINMKTGGGKTLLAVLVIDHYLNVDINRKILFIVPSRALVGQQSKYLRDNCTTQFQLLVAEVSGNEIEQWDRTKWSDMIHSYHIFVGTAEVFRRAFVDQGFLNPSLFSLIVFDECHNAVGNHPMAAILRDSIFRGHITRPPRILGLTASFVNGSLSNIIEKRRKLESLFNATIYSPDIEEDTNISNKSFTFVSVPFEDLEIHSDNIKAKIETILNCIPPYMLSDRNKWILRGLTVYLGVGMEGLNFWLKEGLVAQLQSFYDQMRERQDDEACLRIATRMSPYLVQITQILSTNQIATASTGGSTLFPNYSQKLIVLFRLLTTLYDNSSGGISSSLVNGSSPNRSLRGIVFVEQVAMTYTLAHLVNKYFTSKYQRSSPAQPANTAMQEEYMLPVSGAGSMPDRIRELNLQHFRLGKVPFLVSTNALEEGIDVPECQFVIRFDKFATSKSHIQGSGRARCKAAEIYYFQNDPNVECSKATTLEDVAKATGLSLTAKELQESLVSDKKDALAGKRANIEYPYRPPRPATTAQLSNESEVNFFNCLSIFYEYCQKVLKQSFDPESLFTYRLEVICNIPLETRSVLQTVKYPSPKGYRIIDSTEIDAFWRGEVIEDIVLPKERYKRMEAGDIEKRRAVYVVVVRLHKSGLLRESNEPTAEALARCKHVCPALPMTDRLNLKNRFAPSSLSSSNNAPTNNAPTNNNTNTPQASLPPPPRQASSLSRSSGSASVSATAGRSGGRLPVFSPSDSPTYCSSPGYSNSFNSPSTYCSSPIYTTVSPPPVPPVRGAGSGNSNAVSHRTKMPTASSTMAPVPVPVPVPVPAVSSNAFVDYKSELQRQVQSHYPLTPVTAILQYSSTEVKDGNATLFLSSVLINRTRTVKGDPCSRKEDAEQSVASRILSLGLDNLL